jgi:predicted TIM-barrel fold metal-dependent hydrolase
MTIDENKIWAHSGDSHFLEPERLWDEILPSHLASRMPRSEKISEDEEIIHVDGQSFTWRLPKVMKPREDGKLSMMELSHRPPGARDLNARIADLDDEGIWGEVIYASLGMWESMIQDRELVRVSTAAENEWKASEIKGLAPDRLVPVASLPLRNMDDAVAEARHAKELGLHAVAMPTPGMPNSATLDTSIEPLNSEAWEPLWDVLEELGLVAAFHIGGDPGEHTAYRGLGGAVLNYTNSTYSGQRAAMVMVASGALDRHPDLKMLVSEGGASWVPFLGDRMVEAYRQHSMFVKPLLSRSPKEILYEQVYCSFQHEESAIGTYTALGYHNVLWGSDYPHLEGTFGHTQKTLHELFDDQTPEVTHRITRGSFEELFPHVSAPPATSGASR